MPKTTDRLLLVIGDEKLLVDPGKLLLSEIITTEKATGLTWPEIWLGVNRGHMAAVQAVVWIMRKRSNPRLKLSDVEFSLGDYRQKDPDFDPDYWVPDGPDDELPESARLIDEAFDPDDDAESDSEDPKDPTERPQDTPPEE